MYTVYAIYDKEHNKFYIGQTKDLDERLKIHKEKNFRNSYTARFSGKWELIYKESLDSRSSALIREKQLKSYRGRQFVKSYIPR